MGTIHEYNINGTLILGVDAGYGNYKTAHCTFQTGLTKSAEPPAFSGDYLEYDGGYYIFGEGHKDFVAEKQTDEDNYILTLAAIVKELEKRGVTTARIHLAVGLPLKWVQAQRESFRMYMIQKPHVELKYRGRKYVVDIADCTVVPQCYAAIAENLRAFQGLYMIADIGNGTMNLMILNNGRVSERKSWTVRMGVHQCFMKIQNSVMDRTGERLPEEIIENYLRSGKTEIDEKYAVPIRKQSETVKEQEKQIQELSSQNSALMRELQEKSATIIALNEQIGRLHRSDLELKKAEELRAEADTILASAEKERSIAENAMDQAALLKEDAEAQSHENERERDNLEKTIEKRAEKKANDKVKKIRERYDAMKTKYGTAFGLTIFYGVLITILRVVNSAPARENIAVFLLGIVGIPAGAISAFAEWADHQTVYDGFFVAKVIVLVLLLILLVIIFFVIIGWFCKRIVAYADACTGVIALTGLALVVFLAETLAESPINPGLLYLLIMAGYLGLRSFIEWEDENGTKRDILIMARSLGIGILVAIGLFLLMKWAK